MKYLVVWWSEKGKTRSVFKLLSELKIENDALEFVCGKLAASDNPGVVKILLKYVLFYVVTDKQPTKHWWE